MFLFHLTSQNTLILQSGLSGHTGVEIYCCEILMPRLGMYFSTKNSTQYVASFLFGLNSFDILDWHKSPLRKGSAHELSFVLLPFSFD